MNLKKQLKLFMDHCDLTAAQLSRKSGVSKQVISLWLAGGSPRKLDQVKKVAEVFGTTIDHLCFGEGLAGGDSRDLVREFIGDDWFSGIFEMKIRRLRKGP